MPISRILYNDQRGDGNDIHLLWGETSRELSVVSLVAIEVLPTGEERSHFAAAYPHADIDIAFRPLFRATFIEPNYEGFGIRVNSKTGAVSFTTASPPPQFPTNFIVEAVVTVNLGGIDKALIEPARIRVHVHPARRIWLTPNPMTVRRFTAASDEDTESRFTVRAEFTDGTVGDVTDHHGVSWSPARNVDVDATGTRTGRLKIDAGDAAGTTVTITATWRSVSATADMLIAGPWASDSAMPQADLVDGHPDTWAGTINPRTVPNVLIFGDGFLKGDVPKLEPITNMIGHHLKTDPLTRPFDLLATSMNFWRVAVPAPTRGISVRCEVYTWNASGRTWAKPVPPALPPVPGKGWGLSTLLYMAGLPIPEDASVPNNVLHKRWAGAMRDPPPEISATDPLPDQWTQLINEWKQIATRTFIDEIDGFPAMALGSPPSAAESSPTPLLRLHPYRGADRGLRSFFPVLRATNNVVLDGPFATNALGNVWAEALPTSHFDNASLVVVLSGIKGGRPQSVPAQTLAIDPTLPAQPAHIAMSLDSGNYSMPVRAVVGRRAVAFDFFEPVPDSVSRDLWRTMAHELGHSFGLGDEYVDLPGRYTLAEASVNGWGNLTTEAGVTLGGAINAAAIKWQWHRARKAAFVGVDGGGVGGPIALPGGNLNVPLLRSGGLQFAVGDPVFLRQRQWRKVIGRAPITSVLLQVVAVNPNGSSVTVSGALGNYPATFGDGSVLYVPVWDPALPAVFLDLVAPKIAKFINDNKRPLTPWPCDPSDQPDSQVPEFDGYDGFWSHKNDIRTIGLYSGGARQGCGIFHPAGQCMMRNSHLAVNEFCHVCRFVLVELIDARAHFAIDRDYDAAYPK